MSSPDETAPVTEVVFDGILRRLVLHPTPEGLLSVPEFAADQVVPRDEWSEFETSPPDGWSVKNQGSTGSCNGHAAAVCAEFARHVAAPLSPHVPLSAWWIYGNLATWPLDRGSNIGDALVLCSSSGIAPESDVPYGMWRRGGFTEKAAGDAKRYRIEIGTRLTTDDAFMSAVQRREAINFAIPAGQNLDNLTDEGVSPLSWGFCNHAVCAWGGSKRLRNGRWAFRWVNSWGARFGLAGWAWLPVDGITRTRAFEAYTIRAMVDDPQANDNPPPPVVA